MTLYNKYRPANFTDFVGQDHVTGILNYQLQNKILPQFLIFYGPAGTGKTSMARIVASSLNASKHGLIELDSSAEGGKDSIKDLLTDVYTKPFEGEFKTYLFDEAHEISKRGFGSFLKITEEPPKHVQFIFVTNHFDKIPLNIKSRAQAHCFNLIAPNLIKNRLIDICKLEKEKVPENILDLAVDSGAGSLRNSLVALETILVAHKSGQKEANIADALGILGTKRLSDFLSSAIFNDFPSLLENVKVFYSETTNTERAVFDFQKFAIETRINLVMNLENKDFKVKTYLEVLNNKLAEFAAKSKDKSLAVLQLEVGRRLDLIYDLSLSLEKDLRITSNKQSAFLRFCTKLATSVK